MLEKGKRFSKNIFELAQEGQFSKDFALKDQINRASGSIMDNIAEGFERDGNKEFIYFLTIAKGSAGEVLSQLCRVLDRTYITENQFDKLSNDVKEISGLIGGLIYYLKKTDMKGSKFK